MLRTLENLPPPEAARILARLTLRLLPSPSHNDWRTTSDLGAEDHRVLEDLRQSLRLTVHDHSERARLRMVESLVGLMTQASVPAERLIQIGTRVAGSGDLPLSYYEIRFGASYKEAEAKRGIRKGFVEDAVRTPDKIQWFPPRRNGEKALVFFLKRQPSTRTTEKWLLVHSHVDGSKQEVAKAWWVWRDDIGMSESDAPLDVLRKHVHKYGLSFVIGGSEPMMFAFDQTFPMQGMAPRGQILSVKHSKGVKFEAIAEQTRVSPLGVVEVALAYAIDVSRYESTLRGRAADTR
jgi:hypothetical protein